MNLSSEDSKEVPGIEENEPAGREGECPEK